MYYIINPLIWPFTIIPNLPQNLIEVIAESLKFYKAKNIVVDPVMVSGTGCKLFSGKYSEVLAKKLFSISNLVTPVFPYFAVYIGFMGLYNKNDFSVKRCYNLLLPYLIGITILYLFIIVAWYILGTPIGPRITPSI